MFLGVRLALPLQPELFLLYLKLHVIHMSMHIHIQLSGVLPVALTMLPSRVTD